MKAWAINTSLGFLTKVSSDQENTPLCFHTFNVAVPAAPNPPSKSASQRAIDHIRDSGAGRNPRSGSQLGNPEEE